MKDNIIIFWNFKWRYFCIFDSELKILFDSKELIMQYFIEMPKLYTKVKYKVYAILFFKSCSLTIDLVSVQNP